MNPDDLKSLLDLETLYQNMENREQAIHYLGAGHSNYPGCDGHGRVAFERNRDHNDLSGVL